MAGDEQHADWVERWEDPIWGSLEEVYERAELCPEEVDALDAYRDIGLTRAPSLLGTRSVNATVATELTAPTRAAVILGQVDPHVLW